MVGLAVLRRWGFYDAKVVGVSRDALLNEYIIPMMRYLVATHRTGDLTTGDGKPWGDAWQSAHWAYALGRAAWFVWDDLPADVQAGVRRVVAHETGRFVDATPPHGMKHDTKAEENAWNSRIFSVAVLLMPDDPQRKTWEQAFVRWAISSYMRPSDVDCSQLVDGRAVADWFTGACIFEDFTCENHGFVHPGYMGCIGITLSCHLDFRLSGRVAPRSVAWNAVGVYENLKWMATPDGGYIYPSGQDWSLFRNPQKSHLHLLMAAFEGDPDGTLYVHEELVAVKDVTITQVATGMVGVLNNRQWIHEAGQRTLALDAKSTVIPAESGKTLASEVNQITIDDTMTIASDVPLSIRYIASKGPERGRATDRLYLNFSDEEKTWKAGDTISRYDVVIRVPE